MLGGDFWPREKKISEYKRTNDFAFSRLLYLLQVTFLFIFTPGSKWTKVQLCFRRNAKRQKRNKRWTHLQILIRSFSH